MSEFDRETYEQVEKEIGEGNPDWERDEFHFGLTVGFLASMAAIFHSFVLPVIENLAEIDGRAPAGVVVGTIAFFIARSYARSRYDLIQSRINREYREKMRKKDR